MSLVLALLIAPFPSWAQVGRVAIEAPATPAFGGPVAPTPALGTSLSAASLTPGLGLLPVLSAPAAPDLLKLEAAVPAAAAKPVQTIIPRRAANDPSMRALTLVQPLAEASKAAAEKPESVAALYDGVPDAPDFDALASVKAPAAPKAWTPKSALLKPASYLVNAFRAAAHDRRINNLGHEERVTAEEQGTAQSLGEAYGALKEGRLQDSLRTLASLFKGRDANRWYIANPKQRPYQLKAHEYIRFIEQAVLKAYVRAHGRAKSETLIAEAYEAARNGSLLGHAYRRTQIQDEDSGHCAHHALFNAIQAAAGFAHPVNVHRFVESSREKLNVSAKDLAKSGSELSALEAATGIKLGVDVGQGMGSAQIAKWASMLGVSLKDRAPPRGDEGWSALLRSGDETLLGLRMFHPRFKHGPDEAILHGHEYRELRHGVYLLGAFDSPSLGVRLYMVQDSGSGATDFYTAAELSAVTDGVQTGRIDASVTLPSAN